MASTLPRVLSIPRSDLKNDQDQDQFVLVHVESAGKRPLDLKLIGTDGQSVFSVSLKQNQTFSCKEKKFSGDAEEWNQVLCAVLLDAAPSEATHGVEAAARLEDNGNTLKIIVQKRIEQIRQRLGAITLVEQEEVVELYDWCGLTIRAKDKVSQELEELKAQLKAKEDEANKLNAELAGMVKLKNDHENDLIEKFSLLLNEKKLKIRDQQRLLSGANIDPGRADAVEHSMTPVKSCSPGPSEGRKRKAGQDAQEDTDSDDGFEKMDVDAQQPSNDSEDEQVQTPDQSTADEASDEDEPPAPPPPARKSAGGTTAIGKSAAAKPVTRADPEPLPPPRELPFSKKPAGKKKPPEPAGGEEETESDGDEL